MCMISKIACANCCTAHRLKSRMGTITAIALALALSIGSVSAAEGVAETYPSLVSIKNHGKLRVGVFNDDPYFSYINPTTGKLEGFDADIARALAKEMMGGDDKVEFVVIQSEDRLQALLDGKADLLIAELSMTDKRKSKVDFSDIYYVSGQSIVVRVDSPLQSLEDLKGQTLGAVWISANVKPAESALPNSRFLYFPNLRSGFEALRESKIQAFCVDDVMLMSLRTHPDRIMLNYRFIGNALSHENYGLAVKKGCTELLDAVNTALNKIKANGQWQEIYDRDIKIYSGVSARAPGANLQ